MIQRQFGKFLQPVILLMLVMIFGCAQQMKSVQADTSPVTVSSAELKRITVADDASRIDIISDKPIVYTSYQLDAPPRLVIDVAQATFDPQLAQLEINRGNVKRIEVEKHEFGDGVMARIYVLLTDKADAALALDQQDRSHLVVSLPVSPPATATAIAPAAVAPETGAMSSNETAAPVAVEKSVPVVDNQPVPEGVKEAATGVSVPGSADQGTAVAKEAVKQESQKTEPVPDNGQTEAPAITKPAAKGPGLVGITKNADSIQIEIVGAFGAFRLFKLDQPERLVVDIPRIKSALSTKVVDIDGFNLGKARVGESQEKVRIVFDASNKISHYTATKNSAGILITFGEGRTATGVSAGGSVAPPTGTAETVTVSAVKEAGKSTVTAKAESSTHLGAVNAIEFTHADRVSRITIKTSGNCSAASPVKSGKGVSLTLKNCRLPVKLQRQLDTSGFESAIRKITPYSVKGKRPEARIAVIMSETLPNSLKQEGDVWTWEFSEPARLAKPLKASKLSKEVPATEAPTAPAGFERDLGEAKQVAPENKNDKAMEDAFQLTKAAAPATSSTGKVYTGRKVTLEFSDADIRKIFQLLAEVSNQNFLISDDVTGTISLKLVNVPWDQALDVILENKNLGMRRDGNIVQIRPKSKMKSLDEEAIEMRIIEEKKMPVSTVVFDVNFASLSDVEKQFINVSLCLKSKRPECSISSDLRTNKVIVVDIEPNLKKMRALLDSLDVPEKQVMIEARIVEASTSFVRDIGVKWNFGYQDGSASVANINNITGSMGGVVSSALPTATTGGIATGIAFGKLLSNVQLDMRLSAAATVGQVKIISTPKVMTVNNKAAKISQGQMVPYQNTSSTEGIKTEFIEAALSLEVTPHITSDGSVTMKIKASNNSVGAGATPQVNKKEATTELVVKNGETSVIGGIYVDSETEGDSGVPYLSEIPLLGWLFKSNTKNKTKNELLIFITPKILG